MTLCSCKRIVCNFKIVCVVANVSFVILKSFLQLRDAIYSCKNTFATHAAPVSVEKLHLQFALFICNYKNMFIINVVGYFVAFFFFAAGTFQPL